MNDLGYIHDLLSRRYFAEAAYFGGLSASQSPTALAHLLAGVGCCGIAEPLAIAQRLLEGASVRDEMDAGLRVSPATEMPYEGFFHLIQAIRLDPDIKAPETLRAVMDVVADDLAFASRRELHRPPDKRRRYTHSVTCLSGAVVLRRLTANHGALPGVDSSQLGTAIEIIDKELRGGGSDATFIDD